MRLAVRARPDAKATRLIPQPHPSSLVEIVVTDTGIGIPDADKPHVFEREYRAENVRGIAGTGYGLASVHSSVASYKGTVEIADNKPQGTVFTIRLPLPKPSEEPAAASSHPSTSSLIPCSSH